MQQTVSIKSQLRSQSRFYSLYYSLFFFNYNTSPVCPAGLRASRFSPGHSSVARALCGASSPGCPEPPGARPAPHLCPAGAAPPAAELPRSDHSLCEAHPRLPARAAPSGDFPGCQQMVLCARPKPRRALPGPRTTLWHPPAFHDPSPRQEPWPRQQHGATPPEDAEVFPFKPSTARMARYGLAMPVLDNAELLTQHSSAGSSYLR